MMTKQHEPAPQAGRGRCGPIDSIVCSDQSLDDRRDRSYPPL